jgi:DNA-binding beta-propeller fold protein YncE
MIGPPSAVAVAPDESFALITAAQEFDGDGSGNLVPANIVSVLDLSDPMNPAVRQTVQAGPGASGVTISRDQTLAMVASTVDDGVTVFGIDQGRLSKVGRIQFPAGASPTDVRFTPDGRQALVVRRGDNRITVLDVTGSTVSNSGVDITPGRGPYQIAITPDGQFAITNNLGGAATRAELDAETGEDEQRPRPPGTVSVIDLGSQKLVQSVEVGTTPETVTLSPDGKYLSVVVANGASVQQRASNYSDVHGLLRIYRVEQGNLRPIAVLENGHWCQGATFSDDSRTLLVQCGSERAIEVYRLEGDIVTADPRARIETR